MEYLGSGKKAAKYLPTSISRKPFELSSPNFNHVCRVWISVIQITQYPVMTTAAFWRFFKVRLNVNKNIIPQYLENGCIDLREILQVDSPL
jgi:hypothetical protein